MDKRKYWLAEAFRRARLFVRKYPEFTKAALRSWGWDKKACSVDDKGGSVG